MSFLISCSNQSLPRSIDVDVSISKPQVETTTDLSVASFVSSTGNLPHGAGRIRYYDNLSELEADWPDTTTAFKAGRDFFSQPTRAQTMAVSQAFSTPQPAFLTTAEPGTLAAFQAVSDGSFEITIDSITHDIISLDFSTDVDFNAVALTIQAALNAFVGDPGFLTATVVYTGVNFIITSGTTGDLSTISVLATVSPASGTDVSGVGFLNGQTGATVQGYTPTTFTNELNLITQAATCSGRFVYGWDLDTVYRDAPEQLEAAAFFEAQRAILSVTSNNPLAFDPDSTTDVGAVLDTTANIRSFLFYHDNAEYFPGMAWLAIMLSVDYRGIGTTLNPKFKNLIGIPTVNINETQLTVLESKRYNTFTRVGNNSRTTREGVEVNSSWFMDDLINLDNFAEDLQTAVYNTFLKSGKIPYTITGQAILKHSMTLTCTQYVVNGTFASRLVEDNTEFSGTLISPAFDIIFATIQSATPSERAQRIAPPVTINVNLAGAFNSISIAVNAFS